MIDVTGIFTLWYFHNVENNNPNNVYGNTRVAKIFGGYIYSNKQEKNAIKIGSTLWYSNLMFGKNKYCSFYKIRPNNESSSLFNDQLFERTNRMNVQNVTRNLHSNLEGGYFNI